MTSSRRLLMFFLAVAIVAVAGMPLLLRQEEPVLDQRRTAITEMSNAERARLDRNFQRYQTLSETQREEYRQLHAELEADAANNHGRANESLQTYRAWLTSISPRERAELGEVPDPAAKVRLVREILDRHANEELEFQAGESLRRLGPIPSLKPDDLDRVLALIHEATESDVDASELEGFAGMLRTLKLFELLGRKNQKLATLLTPGRTRELIAAITNESDRQMLEHTGDNREGGPQIIRAKLAITLLKNLEVAVQRELRRQQVTPQALQIVYAELSEAEQDELLELSATQFRAELRRRHADVTASGRINRREVEQFLRPDRDTRPRRKDGAPPRQQRPAETE